ncbi:IS630 family transposase, partial [Halorubrum sp. GN12_10-3_MGM]
IVVESEAEFKELVQETFEKITKRVSFAKKWCEQFLDFRMLS